jgi:elongation factor G
MKHGVEGPVEFQGSALTTILHRRGTVIGTTEAEGFCQVEAEVPLASMVGYATELRSNTQGKAEFTLEFARYAPAPRDVTEELIKKYGTRVKGSDEE